MNYKKKSGLIIAFIFLFSLNNLMSLTGAERQPLVYTLRVEDTVTAGTAKTIIRGLSLAEKDGAEAAVILLNTPGGLVTATLEIIQAMSASPVPVITYVSPQGGIAASAGTFILLNGHIASMSPGTTCGAAMPVTMNVPGEATKAADQKTINFLAGHMKSIAGERGRPVDLAEKFVTENLSLSSGEALEKGVVNLNAADLDELLIKINGITVQTKAGSRTLETTGARVMELSPNANERLLQFISNPSVAAILLMLGIYGLIIGFYSPGFFLPEIFGSISLILGLAGMGLFQGNMAAAVLILLGVVLLVAEFFTPTYGVLGIGGIASLVLGILFFPLEPLMPAGFFSAFKSMALGIGVIGGGFLLIVIRAIARTRKQKTFQGEDEFINTPAIVIEDLKPEGLVKIKGEIWKAISKKGHTIAKGEKVEVLERIGMALYVEDKPRNDSGE